MKKNNPDSSRPKVNFAVSPVTGKRLADENFMSDIGKLVEQTPYYALDVVFEYSKTDRTYKEGGQDYFSPEEREALLKLSTRAYHTQLSAYNNYMRAPDSDAKAAHKWLNGIKQSYYGIVINMLYPHTQEFAQRLAPYLDDWANALLLHEHSPDEMDLSRGWRRYKRRNSISGIFSRFRKEKEPEPVPVDQEELQAQWADKKFHEDELSSMLHKLWSIYDPSKELRKRFLESGFEERTLYGIQIDQEEKKLKADDKDVSFFRGCQFDGDVKKRGADEIKYYKGQICLTETIFIVEDPASPHTQEIIKRFIDRGIYEELEPDRHGRNRFKVVPHKNRVKAISTTGHEAIHQIEFVMATVYKSSEENRKFLKEQYNYTDKDYRNYCAMEHVYKCGGELPHNYQTNLREVLAREGEKVIEPIAAGPAARPAPR